MGELLVHGTQEYVKLVENARHVRRGGAREDVQDFLAAIHRIQQIEHETDEAQRAIKRALVARRRRLRARCSCCPRPSRATSSRRPTD